MVVLFIYLCIELFFDCREICRGAHRDRKGEQAMVWVLGGYCIEHRNKLSILLGHNWDN